MVLKWFRGDHWLVRGGNALRRGRVVAAVLAVLVIGALGFVYFTGIDPAGIIAQTRRPVYGVPESSASAVTSPPPSMVGVNTHDEVVGTGADPDVVTLGPRTGGCEGCPAYEGKVSLDFELAHGEPVLAPLDMVFVGFSNRNAERRTRGDVVQSPYDDLELFFISGSDEWPGMLVSVYHLSTSPLLVGHVEGAECYMVEEWMSTHMAQGFMFYERDEVVFRATGGAEACEGLLGRLVRRGDVIGYAGSVGGHSMASFKFKVSSTEVNPTVRTGGRHVHWVQPSEFFYWMCYTPGVVFPEGVLAYPFACDEYELPEEMRDPGFKYG